MFLLWVGCRKRTYWIGVLLSIMIPIAVSEGLASYEEYWFMSQCKTNPSQFSNPTSYYHTHDRWWPNSNHHLGYDSFTGKFFGTD